MCGSECQFVCFPTGIDSFILPWSSKFFWGSVLLQLWLSPAVESRLGSKSAIDDWLTSCCLSTPIASKCDHLDRAMFLLAFLDSPGIFFVLGTIGIVDCMFCRLPIALLCPSYFYLQSMEWLFYFRLDVQNGMETTLLAATVCLLIYLQGHSSYWVITPRACTRGKVIGRVVIHKISPDLGI